MGITAFRNTKHMSEEEKQDSYIYGSLLIIIPILALMQQLECYEFVLNFVRQYSIGQQSVEPKQVQKTNNVKKQMTHHPPKNSKAKSKILKQMIPSSNGAQNHFSNILPNKLVDLNISNQNINNSKTIIQEISDTTSQNESNITEPIILNETNTHKVIQLENENIEDQSLLMVEKKINQEQIQVTKIVEKLANIQDFEEKQIPTHNVTQIVTNNKESMKSEIYIKSKIQIQQKIMLVEEQIKKLSELYNPFQAIQEAQQQIADNEERQRQDLQSKVLKKQNETQQVEKQRHDKKQQSRYKYQISQVDKNNGLHYVAKSEILITQQQPPLDLYIQEKKSESVNSIQTQTDGVQDQKGDSLNLSKGSGNSKGHICKLRIDDLIELDQCGNLTIQSILEIIDYVPNMIQKTNNHYMLKNREDRRTFFIKKNISQYLQCVMEYLEKTYELVDDGQKLVVEELGLNYQLYLDSLSIHYNNHLTKDIFTHISQSLLALKERMPVKKKLLLKDGLNLLKFNLEVLKEGKDNYYLSEIIPLFIMTQDQREILFSVLAVFFEDILWDKFQVEEEDKIYFLSQIYSLNYIETYQSDKQVIDLVFQIENQISSLIRSFLQINQ